MVGLARTCALALLSVGGSLAACGHLAFDEIPLDADAGGGVDAAGLADGNAGDGGLDAGDGGCAGPTCVGTFVSGTLGNDSNPGTASKPVRTIKAAIGIAVALGGGQSVFVAATHYAEKVTLAEGVDLLGGYDCNATSCTWGRDVVANDTAILDQDDEGVVAPKTVTRKTRFDGFRVAGKGGPPSGPPGSAAMSLVSGTPTVTRCRVFGGDVTGGGANAKSIGVAVLGPSNDSGGALIEGNVLSGGASTDQSIGLLFDTKVGAAAGSAAVALVISNTIRGGAAPFTNGVVARSTGIGTVLKSNEIAGGPSSASGSSNGASWGIVVGGTMTIDANHINTDLAAAGSCTSVSGAFCGGIQSQGATTSIINNVVLGGRGPKTCAVLLADGESALGSVILNSNTLDGAGDGGPDGTISTALALRISLGNSATLGKVRNNILLGGLNKNRYGVYEDAVAGRTARPSVLENNDFWNAGTPRNDFAYRVWSGSTGTDVLFASLGTIAAGSTPVNNLNVDPLLDTTYHLPAGSPVIDKGTPTEAPARDLDDDSRPKGGVFDIGADEAK